MFRSPPANRTRGKTADKKKTERSLSLDSDPADKTDKGTMAPAADKINEKFIEECVKRSISSQSYIDVLVTKLSEHIKIAIQEAIDASLKPLNEEVNRLKLQVAELTELVKLQDRQVKCKMDDLQQYQRRNNVRVFGIPETRGEDTDQLVVDLCKEKLGVDVPVSAICRSHRVGPKAQTKEGTPRHRPIIIKFISYRDRRRVFAEKKKLKGTGFVIREDLTAVRLEIFKRAAAVHGGRNTWTIDGRVMWIDGDGNRGSATRLEDLSEA